MMRLRTLLKVIAQVHSYSQQCFNKFQQVPVQQNPLLYNYQETNYIYVRKQITNKYFSISKYLKVSLGRYVNLIYLVRFETVIFFTYLFSTYFARSFNDPFRYLAFNIKINYFFNFFLKNVERK